MVLDGLQNALVSYDFIEVTGTYSRAGTLLKALQQYQPDVLLLDVQLPDAKSNKLAQEILCQYPQVRILVLSGLESHYYVKDMLQQGCSGYLLKSTTDRDLLAEAIRSVHDGNLFLDPSIKEQLLHDMLQTKKKAEQIYPRITDREKEVLELIVREYSNQEIADKLEISLRTAENHRYNLLHKLNVKNTVGLVRVAIEMKLLG